MIFFRRKIISERNYAVMLCGLGLFLLQSCANIVAPTGGDKDVTAPVMKQKDFTDSMLKVNGRTFTMEFDEFVQVKDVQNQLIMTPLTTAKPKLTAHKRKVELQIADSLLLPNTTYSIQFGKSIADMHEGNAAQIPDITFSTGQYFDSLFLQGRVWDSETGAPDTGSLVMLYDAAKADTVVEQDIPLYIQKTKGGLFSFQNLPFKRFRVFAVGDKNNNLKYDRNTESMAFLNEVVQSGDTSSEINLYVFHEKKDVKDSLGARNNTPKGRAAKPIPFTYSLNADTSDIKKRSFDLTDSLSISFSIPFKKWEKEKIILKQNNVIDATAIIAADSTGNTISIKTEWLEDAVYEVQLMDGFTLDSAGTSGKAGVFRFHTKRSSDYGTLVVKPVVNNNDWLFLFSENQFIRKIKVTDTLIQFRYQRPGTYQLRMLHDKNGNGSYDPGNFKERRQPEMVERIPRDILIKANWENVLDLRTDDNNKNIRKR